MKFNLIPKDKTEGLPKTSGVYCFKNKGWILYIGKAANIKERVKSHFNQSNYRDKFFINQIKKIGYIKTDSEIEALILEANLIKKYRPKYNVIWKDDKNYFFVGATQETFPRIFITHQPNIVSRSLYLVSGIRNKKIQNTRYKIPNTQYVGPFVDGKSLKATLKALRKVFPYRSCANLPKKSCLWHQLGRCPAPCALKSSLARQIPTAEAKMKQEYKKNIKDITEFLRGGKNQLLKNLQKRMKESSLNNDFEEAGEIRDQIRALEKVLAHSRIFEPITEKIKEEWLKTEILLQNILNTKKKISRIEGYDISNIQGKEATGSMITFIDGTPDKNFYRRFKIKVEGKPDDTAMLKEILKRRMKHGEWPYPDLILIDGGIAQLNAALKAQSQKSLPAVATALQAGKVKRIKIIAIAKKNNELFIEGRKNPILLKNLPREIFNLILQIRDEAHRFAVKYHLYLRRKKLMQ